MIQDIHVVVGQVVLMPPRDILKQRLEARWQSGEHFMPPSQLDAQLADLEIDAAPPPPQPLLGKSSTSGTADTQVS